MQFPAELSGALVQAAQAKTGRADFFRQADAIVADLQSYMIFIAFQDYPNLLRLGVTLNIGKRFLDSAINRQAVRIGQ